MYGLWIQKPLNIQTPTTVELGDDLGLLGYGLERSNRGDQWAGFLFQVIPDPIYRNSTTPIPLRDKPYPWDPAMVWYSNLRPMQKQVLNQSEIGHSRN
jgi:hypothetical protein